MPTNKKPLFYGFNPPFFSGPQNILSRQEDDRLIKNDVLQLILTVPGTRVMRPRFGTELRSFVFEPMVDNDLFNLEISITNAIQDQDQRLTVDVVRITRDDDRNGINVLIVVRLKKDPARTITIEQFLTTRT